MSNLINKTRLQKFAEGFWDKIKRKYDNSLNGATISASDSTDKKITFTRISGTDEVVNLKDYTRLQDRNEFKKDVSVDNAGSVSNLNIGRINGNTSNNRVLGYRGTTSKSFVDGYVDHLIIYMSSDLTEATQIQTKVWAITKGNTTREDRHLKLVHNGSNFPVETFDENGTQRKCIKVPIGEKFTNETYFMVKCPNHELQVCNNIDTKYDADVINMSVEPATTGEIDFTSNNTNNTAIIHLVGRESIKSLSEKINKTNSDSTLYVKHSETTVQGGNASDNGKVVKLGANGKLDDSILPAIALNEFFSVTAATWNEAALSGTTYQNGDIIYHTNTQKRYLCINKNETFENRFVELNSKDGVVSTVNGKTGAVELSLEATNDKFKLKINGTGGEVVKELDMISEQEITEILDSLPQ